MHTVSAPAGLDAALDGIDVPHLARVDEVVPITVHVSSGRETPATVTLRCEGVDIGTQNVELVPGDNVVTFSDTTGPQPGSLLRYGNEIYEIRPGDAISCPVGTATAHQLANPIDPEVK